MWEFVDKVIYINLDKRQDRRNLMKKFFEVGQIPEDKIVRCPGVLWNPGIVGCGKGHLAAVKMAKENGWKRVLILEDDVGWHNFDEGYAKLEKLVQLPNWDVCLIGGWYCDVSPPRVKACICAHAYIVNSHYYDTLIQNYEEGIQKRLKIANDMYHIDVYWIKLQMQHNWIGVIDPMCIQIESFSNVRSQTISTKGIHIDDNMKIFAKSVQNAFMEDIYYVKLVRTPRGFVRQYVKK